MRGEGRSVKSKGGGGRETCVQGVHWSARSIVVVDEDSGGCGFSRVEGKTDRKQKRENRKQRIPRWQMADASDLMCDKNSG